MHHIIVVNKQNNGLKNKVKEILNWPPNSPDLNNIENFLEIIKRELQKENISKRSILIIRINRFMKILHKNTLRTFLSHL